MGGSGHAMLGFGHGIWKKIQDIFMPQFKWMHLYIEPGLLLLGYHYFNRYLLHTVKIKDVRELFNKETGSGTQNTNDNSIFYNFRIIKACIAIECIAVLLIPLYCNKNMAQTIKLYYFLYWFWLCAPFLKSYMKLNKKMNIAFILFWLSSVMPMLIVGFTFNNAGTKAPWGAYPGYFYSLMIYFMLLNIILQRHRIINYIMCFMIPVYLLKTYYSNTFFYGSISECDYRVESGIFKGLKIKKEDGKKYEKIEKILDEQLGSEASPGHETILFTDYTLVAEYLSSDRIPLATTPNWAPFTLYPDGTMNWEFTELYWEHIGAKPDDIVKPLEQVLTGDIVPLLQEQYEKIYQDEYLEIYHHSYR